MDKTTHPWVDMKGKSRMITRDAAGNRKVDEGEKIHTIYFGSPDEYLVTDKIIERGWEVVDYGGFELKGGKEWLRFKRNLESRLIPIRKREEEKSEPRRSKAKSATRLSEPVKETLRPAGDE